MNRRCASYRPFGLVLAAALCAAGMWIYTSRVLIPYQTADAAAHHRPRGNLSDLYPRWLGARELLLRGRDPYSAAVTRDIQQGYYGRPLDSARPGDPRDQQGFAYPVYVVFCLAPTVNLPFEIIRKVFFWVLLAITLATIPLWLGVLRWSVPRWAEASLIVFILGSLPVMQGLELQQLTLIVVALLAAAMALLGSDHPIAAGIALALATIKPQLVLPLLFWLVIWALADWHRRYRGAVSFLLTMATLCAASELYLPHWIHRFWLAIHEYQSYTGATSVMDKVIGAPWSWALELLALAGMIVACWRERRQAANTDAFAFTLSLVLASTVLIVPTYAPYNQVLLIPALLIMLKERRTIWHKSIANRALVAITSGLIFWPWISSLALAGLSFVLQSETVQCGWAVPFWTTLQIPMGVTALMLAHYYQRTFTTPARSSSQ